MKSRFVRISLGLVIATPTIFLSVSPSRARDPEQSGGSNTQTVSSDLGTQAEAVLNKHCYRCHGQNGSKDGDFSNVHKLAELVADKKVVPNDPVKSEIYRRMAPDLVGDMPFDAPGDVPTSDLEIIRKWIEAGAPQPVKSEIVQLPPRPRFELFDEVRAVDKFLSEKVNQRDWASYRFFTLRNLWNAPRDKVQDKDFASYKAALSKLINSLSWRSKIVLPVPVDENGIVLAVNIDQLDWLAPGGKNLWQDVLVTYPYGLSHDIYPANAELSSSWKTIVSRTTSSIPIIRTDWFIAKASRPPLYHSLAQIPDTLDELTRKLPVSDRKTLDPQMNISEGNVVRSGFNNSGVSKRNNRLIERHETNYGAFWISYDFKISAGRGNLFVFPLGPSYASNPFEKHSFLHDGGEIIFNLPNGMQAYMLIDGKGRRLDEGPLEIVSDTKDEVSGTPAIVNGLSCIACHRTGMIRKEDQILQGHVLYGAASEQIKRIYLPSEDLKALFQQDEDRFLAAANQAVRPFMLTGKSADKTLRDFPEPVAPIAKWYVAEELTLDDVSRELGLDKPESFERLLAGSEELKRNGLFPLSKGLKIKREVWESQDFVESAFQRSAALLELGEPQTIRRKK